MIRAAILSGAIAGGASREDQSRLQTFGGLIGWAFQVTDDILDVEESSAALGKTAGKDQAQQKATYPALFGLEKSHEFARELAARAMGARSIPVWREGRESAGIRRISRLAPRLTAVKSRPHPETTRLDVLLVERSLVESRQKAQAVILAGEVRVDGQRAEKTGAMFPADARIEISGRGSRYARAVLGKSSKARSRISALVRRIKFGSTRVARREVSPIACSTTARRKSAPWTSLSARFAHGGCSARPARHTLGNECTHII